LLKKVPKIGKSKRASKEGSGENATRMDKVLEKPASLANNLIAAAPDKKDGYIKVKNILNGIN
jgi:Asp-tRNA(Asn)/Glu-tRNA(Gln) amidotransferase C subunit